MWGLGCLVWEVYNGPLTQTSALRNTSKVRTIRMNTFFFFKGFSNATKGIHTGMTEIAYG